MTMDRRSRPESAITVIGSNEVRARANLMHVVLEIRTRAGTAAEALQENNLREEMVRARLRAIRIHEESVESSGVTFLPAAGDGIVLPGSSEPQGFVAVRMLAINIYLPEDEGPRGAARLARILDEAAEGGAQPGARHQVNLAIFRTPSVSYGLENDQEYRTEALRRAMIAARVAGQETAASMGMELGEIVSTQVLELGGLVQGRWAAAAFSQAGLDMPKPTEAGRVVVRAVVAVTFRVWQPSMRTDTDRDALRARYTIESADHSHPAHPDHTPELS